jgi:hypothetical protein
MCGFDPSAGSCRPSAGLHGVIDAFTDADRRPADDAIGGLDGVGEDSVKLQLKAQNRIERMDAGKFSASTLTGALDQVPRDSVPAPPMAEGRIDQEQGDAEQAIPSCPRDASAFISFARQTRASWWRGERARAQ